MFGVNLHQKQVTINKKLETFLLNQAISSTKEKRNNFWCEPIKHIKFRFAEHFMRFWLLLEGVRNIQLFTPSVFNHRTKCNFSTACTECFSDYWTVENKNAIDEIIGYQLWAKKMLGKSVKHSSSILKSLGMTHVSVVFSCVKLITVKYSVYCDIAIERKSSCFFP